MLIFENFRAMLIFKQALIIARVRYVYSVLEEVLISESSVKAEIKFKIISNFKIDFLERPNGKDYQSNLSLDGASAIFSQNNLDTTWHWVQKIHKVIILDLNYLSKDFTVYILTSVSNFRGCIGWYLTVTPSIGIENKHRISISNALM